MGMLAPSATTLAPTPSADSGFWDQFFTSAGFAGAMAVVAASIASVVAWRQFRGTQRQNEIARWWDTLTWVYDRSIVEKGTKTPLPQTVAVRMLRALFDGLSKEGQDPLQRQHHTVSSQYVRAADTPPFGGDRDCPGFG